MSEFEFKVIVHNYLITALTPNGIVKTDGKVKLDPLTFDTINIFKDWLNKGKISDSKELVVLGKYLYKAIFGDLEGAFKNYYKKAREEDKSLVVQLGFEVTDPLANWPWEYLYSPDDDFFLVDRFDLVVSRYVSHNEESKPPQPKDSPLRVLVVISCLEDKHLRDAWQIFQAIEGLVKDKDLPIESHVLKTPTFNDFLDELELLQPHVLHFIGHSRFKDKGEETEIALFNSVDKKSIRWMSDRDFIRSWVNGSKTKMPPLVFFHLCKTSNYDIAHLAFQLSKAADIPVVATQHPISDTAAKYFCIAFYSALASGQSIPSAVQNGRIRIGRHVSAKDYRDFGAIVLYMRNADASIIRSEKRKRRNLDNSIQMLK